MNINLIFREGLVPMPLLFCSKTAYGCPVLLVSRKPSFAYVLIHRYPSTYPFESSVKTIFGISVKFEPWFHVGHHDGYLRHCHHITYNIPILSFHLCWCSMLYLHLYRITGFLLPSLCHLTLSEWVISLALHSKCDFSGPLQLFISSNLMIPWRTQAKSMNTPLEPRSFKWMAG